MRATCRSSVTHNGEPPRAWRGGVGTTTPKRVGAGYCFFFRWEFGVAETNASPAWAQAQPETPHPLPRFGPPPLPPGPRNQGRRNGTRDAKTHRGHRTRGKRSGAPEQRLLPRRVARVAELLQHEAGSARHSREEIDAASQSISGARPAALRLRSNTGAKAGPARVSARVMHVRIRRLRSPPCCTPVPPHPSALRHVRRWAPQTESAAAAALRPHHQNEAISSNSIVHMASVPTAMNTDCGDVGSCSSSDMTRTL
jgi:hypothetical protein